MLKKYDKGGRGRQKMMIADGEGATECGQSDDYLSNSLCTQGEGLRTPYMHAAWLMVGKICTGPKWPKKFQSAFFNFLI